MGLMDEPGGVPYQKHDYFDCFRNYDHQQILGTPSRIIHEHISDFKLHYFHLGQGRPHIDSQHLASHYKLHYQWLS